MTTIFLFMWATGPFIGKAIELGIAWGFKYKTVFIVWDKVDSSGNAVLGTGWYTRPSHEYVLVFTKGRPLQFKQTCSLRQGIRCKRLAHSMKPDQCRKLISDFTGNIPTIELFARKPYGNWAVWGDQLSNENSDNSDAGTDISTDMSNLDLSVESDN
mmetsp:Transcript_11021/g.13033  ORF Transcript_11021/g.13033 Transcript_11021/m.13033 type:complete len:157 (-) Transcript_11021:33-503(-)